MFPKKPNTTSYSLSVIDSAKKKKLLIAKYFTKHDKQKQNFDMSYHAWCKARKECRIAR